MAEKTLQSRVLMKNDTAENWAKGTNFSPKKGEVIVYNGNPPRIKVGDGSTNVNNLPFITYPFTQEQSDKLGTIEEGANKYILPTASSTLGGVKTTSTVSSTSGLTATPIINGVPYYKDTTYTLSGLGGVPTSRKINGKALSADITLSASDVGAAASSHTHSYLPLSGGTISGSLAVSGNITSNGYSVYTAGGNVIYSSTQPTGSAGMIWLKPV